MKCFRLLYRFGKSSVNRSQLFPKSSSRTVFTAWCLKDGRQPSPEPPLQIRYNRIQAKPEESADSKT
jgi:hypothetical protein